MAYSGGDPPGLRYHRVMSSDYEMCEAYHPRASGITASDIVEAVRTNPRVAEEVYNSLRVHASSSASELKVG